MYRRNFTDASCLRSKYRIHHFWSVASTVKGVAVHIPLATVRFAYARDCIPAVRSMPIENLCRDTTGYACGSHSSQPPPPPGPIVPTTVHDSDRRWVVPHRHRVQE